MTLIMRMILDMQLMEGYQVNSLQLNPAAEDIGYGRQPAQAHEDAFFHPLHCEPTLQIGYAFRFQMIGCIMFITFELGLMNIFKNYIA